MESKGAQKRIVAFSISSGDVSSYNLRESDCNAGEAAIFCYIDVLPKLWIADFVLHPVKAWANSKYWQIFSYIL